MMTIGQRRELKALRAELEWAAAALPSATERAEASIAGVFVARLLDGSLNPASASSWIARTSASVAGWRGRQAANDVSVLRAARTA